MENTKIENSSRQMAAAANQRKVWGSVIFNVKDYGADGDGINNDTAAIARAATAAKQNGGGIVRFPPGIYLVDGIDVSGLNNVTFQGSGADSTFIRTTSPTADIFTSTTPNRWLRYENFAVDSSVTRTTGAHFKFTTGQYRIVFNDLKLKDWVNGIVLETFEQCWITRCQIAEPDGAGTAISVGKAADAAQGANLNIVDCFIRGTNGPDGVGGVEVGDYGVGIYDADAVFMMNTDVGGNRITDLLIAPNTRSANHYFSQCFFDATTLGPSISMEGAGVKQEITFTGCWIGGAGQNAGGANDVPGLWVKNIGTYRTLQFTGCRFHINKGSGVKYEPAGGDATFTGCLFSFNGQGGVPGDNHGFYLNSGVGDSAHIVGCTFGGSNGDDIYVSASSRLYTIQDCYLAGTFTNLGQGKNISGITTSNSGVVASAATITLPAGLDLVRITGTANIAGIALTYTGHRVTLIFSAALTVVTMSQNLFLAGHFEAVANSTLTLVCDGLNWYEVARKL